MRARFRLLLFPALMTLIACGGDDGTGFDDDEDFEDDSFDVVTDRIGVPAQGTYYHGVFPGETLPGEESGITPADVASYEAAVGRQVAWVYFSHNWYEGRSFPLASATWIREGGAVPFIRLMLRSSEEQDVAESTYTLQRIIEGDFDDDLEAWGNAARDFASPLIVEWGTEMNGEWFSWNGVWNGGAGDGPSRFRQAYRHIHDQIHARGAQNITWVFHADVQDAPEEPWNAFENYYPGSDVVDWIGFSDYGAATPLDDEWIVFAVGMDQAVQRAAAMAPGKPVFVLEFAVTMGNPLGDAAEWTDTAMNDILTDRWPSVRGFSWWNEWWENDDDPSHNTDMRVQTVPGLAAVMQAHLVGNTKVLDRPILP